MLENIKIYTSDKYWNQIFTDLGALVVTDSNMADVSFEDVTIKTPISIVDLKRFILNSVDNSDIIQSVFGKNIILSKLQHKIIVLLYKNPEITMRRLKEMLGVLPDISTHTVENAIYQLRKLYGHDLIQNIDGKYKIGHI